MPQHNSNFRRLAAIVPEELRRDFLDVAEKAGETGSGLLRRFMVDAVERAKRGEAIKLQIQPEAPR